MSLDISFFLRYGIVLTPQDIHDITVRVGSKHRLVDILEEAREFTGVKYSECTNKHLFTIKKVGVQINNYTENKILQNIDGIISSNEHKREQWDSALASVCEKLCIDIRKGTWLSGVNVY